MLTSFSGVVVKTVPRIVIQLSTGKEFSPRPDPSLKWLSFGVEVLVTFNYHGDRIGQILPKNEGSCLAHDPVNFL